MKLLHLFPAILISTALVSPSLMAENALPQGDFHSGVAGGLPVGWDGHQQPHLDRVKGTHELVMEGDETFLRLEKQLEDSVLRVETSQKLPEGTQEITLSVTDRVMDITPGADNPNRNVFRVGVAFRDAADNVLQEATPQIARLGTRSDWKTDNVTYQVPEGADNVAISLMMLNCSGIWEVQTVSLTLQ